MKKLDCRQIFTRMKKPLLHICGFQREQVFTGIQATGTRVSLPSDGLQVSYASQHLLGGLIKKVQNPAE
jgi:hypothetical protein